MLLSKFKKHISEEGIIADGDGLVVGVSGGIDSIVLLDLIARVAKKMSLKIVVAHVNYSLRGRESDRDENIVFEAANEYSIPVEILRKKPREGKNLQNSAREIRFKYYQDIASRYNLESVATAHHMDDQAETILLHMIRGSGLRGLAGIQSVSKMGGLKLIRPLLPFSKSELEEYAKKRKLKYEVDSTNLKSDYSRNSIRNELVPALKKFNPRIVESLHSMSIRIASDDDALGMVADESFEDALIKEGKGLLSMSRAPVQLLPKGIRYRVMMKAFERAAGSLKDLNSDQLDKIDRITLSKEGKGSYRLPSRWKFERKGELLTLRRCKTKCDR